MTARSVAVLLCPMIGMCLLCVSPAAAAETGFAEQVKRVVTLSDYNTRVVILGTTLLGISGGVVGVFMLLRKRSLVGDVVGHSALPGIAIAFILTEMFSPGHGKHLPTLLLGAFVAGTLGAICVTLIDRYSRIKPDAAMAIVLSFFYGAGTALLTVVQRIPTSSAAGLKDFLAGKTASLVADDVELFAWAAVCVVVITTLFFKELTLMCFDAEFAAALGWKVFLIDSLLIGLVVSVTILGMQSVGLLLVVAILIIPAASSRFWSDNIRAMTLISAFLGGLGAAVGTVASALFAKIAAGAVIVLTGSVLFLISLLLGTRRGILWRWMEHRRLQIRSGQRDLLRAIYEHLESQTEHHPLEDADLIHAPLALEQLVAMRTWSPRDVRRLVNRAVNNQLLTAKNPNQFLLTPDGAVLARRATRDHRLWEQYLIHFAEIAPSHVDRDADQIEHVLSPELLRELEQRLAASGETSMPSSPHLIDSHSEES